MRATLRFLRALVATNLKASLALRGAFWARVVFMMANNLIFFVMWWVFFERFEEVRGWRLPDRRRSSGSARGRSAWLSSSAPACASCRVSSSTATSTRS